MSSKSSADRVGGRAASAALPHQQAYGSVPRRFRKKVGACAKGCCHKIVDTSNTQIASELQERGIKVSRNRFAGRMRLMGLRSPGESITAYLIRAKIPDLFHDRYTLNVSETLESPGALLFILWLQWQSLRAADQSRQFHACVKPFLRSVRPVSRVMFLRRP